MKEHPQMSTSCVYLWILRNFPERLFYRALLGVCLFHVQVAEFQTVDTIKTYFTCAYVLFKYFIQEREVAIHLEVGFIYLKSLKLSMKKLICNEVARCQPATLWKNSFMQPPSCILPSFSQNASWLLLSKRLWKCASTISFQKYKRKGVLLVIYLFNYDSSKSTFFIMNMAFDVVLSKVFVK